MAGFQTLVDALPLGIVVHRDRRILYANRICLDVLGLERLDSLLGRDPLELLSPADREKHVQRIAAIERGEPIPAGLASLKTPDGRSYALELAGIRVDFEGAPA